MLVPPLVILILALGTAPPEASVTVPRIVPPVTWPLTVALKSKRVAHAAIHRTDLVPFTGTPAELRGCNIIRLTSLEVQLQAELYGAVAADVRPYVGVSRLNIVRRYGCNRHPLNKGSRVAHTRVRREVIGVGLEVYVVHRAVQLRPECPPHLLIAAPAFHDPPLQI